MAVYELSTFPEYKELTLPIIRYYLKKTGNEPDESLFREALIFTKGKFEIEKRE